ncbi:beta-lactamase family protein [Shimia sp. CNT1-13L.2]|uniref:serine hydrolase domain-containing protein n=1 Tax=Shimia sp. CNT1-13L.2 TaxID=2959663 RepID=UPI0020CD907F|nr:serine hydrolase [Shimia sp. CNT1-13L.2]MCP9483915.1 beta-lactamase family protein [Shimia sp. CNT1-13L.2]
MDSWARWQAIFAPETIDENFRALWQQLPSVAVPRAGAVLELPRGAVTLPEVFSHQGQDIGLAAHLERMRMSGLAVMHRGRLVHEVYGRGRGPEDVAILWSVSKSITALMLGIAREEGALPDLDALVTEYVPELSGTGYEGVTVQQVSDMVSGIRWREVYDDPEAEVVRSVAAFMEGSQDAFAAEMVRQRAPGAFGQYASIETHVLGWVIRRATGVPMQTYLAERLWGPLGCEGDLQVLVDTKGEPVVFGGMHVRLRDLVRVGQMILDGGRALDGGQVVPERWIREMAVPDHLPSRPGIGPPHSESDYGYKNQWWLPPVQDGGDFSGIGIYGQFLYINPERQVAIAMNAAYPQYTQDGPDRTAETLSMCQAIARALDAGE